MNKISMIKKNSFQEFRLAQNIQVKMLLIFIDWRIKQLCISVDAKIFDKFNIASWYTLNKLGIYLNRIKPIYDKSVFNITLFLYYLEQDRDAHLLPLLST